MKFKTHTLILIAITVALFLVYMNIERFTTTITIPDDLIKSQIADTVADKKGKKNKKKSKTPISDTGAEFAKLPSSASRQAGTDALIKDVNTAMRAVGLAPGNGLGRCTEEEKGTYTSSCKVGGFCTVDGFCDVTPEDMLAYKYIEQRDYDTKIASLRK